MTLYFLTTVLLLIDSLCQSNLIMNGGFEIYQLNSSKGYLLQPQYQYSLFPPDGIWRGVFTNGTLTQFEVRNQFEGASNNLLDIFHSTQCWYCQNVQLQVNKKYYLKFDYLSDAFITVPEIIIRLNNQIFHQFYFSTPGVYNQSFIAQMQISQVCFYAPKLFIISFDDGVMIDNITLTQATVTHNVIFSLTKMNKDQICFKSNFQVDILQISKFQQTKILIGNHQIMGPTPLNFNDQLSFCMQTSMFEYHGSEVVIQLPNLSYLDNNNNSVIFIVNTDRILNVSTMVFHWDVFKSKDKSNTLCMKGNLTLDQQNLQKLRDITINYGTQRISNYEIQILKDYTLICFQTAEQHIRTDKIIIEMSQIEIFTQDTYYYKIKNQISEVPLIIIEQDESNYLINEELQKQMFKTINLGVSIALAFLSASFIFKLVSFSNLMILYIFLDTGLLNSSIRFILEQFSRLLQTQGLIASITKMAGFPIPEFLQKQLYIPNKIPQQVPKKGSHFTILGISTQSSKLCVDDSVVMLTNILKICFVWAVGVCLSKKQMFAKFISPKELGSESYKAIVYEIIAPAPLWTLVSGIILSAEQDNVNATNFIDKLNTSFLVGIPIVLLLIGVSWFRHCRIDKALEDLKKQEEKTEKVMERKMDRIELLDILQYILLGLFVGFQSLLVFFLVGNLFCIYSFYELIRNLHLSFQCIVMAAKKCFEAVIHFSFFFLLCLELILEQTESPDIQLVIISVANDLSVGIFYAYLLGCLTMALLFVVEIIIMLYKFVCFWWKVCTQKNTVVNWQEYSVQQQSKNKSNNINNKQNDQIIQPQFFIVKNSTAIHYRNNKIVTKKTIGAGKDLLEFRDLKWQE